MSSPTSEPVINSNPSLQKYYASLESRIGYKLLLGGTRHFGYYERSTSWPFLISRALRAMEDHLFKTLSLEKGAFVLDAGCGVGHVAIHLARKGLRVQGIDVIDRSIEEANRNIKAEALESAVAVQKMDYHHLDGFEVNKFDGVYTMETFVHATDPEGALKKNFRVLKPGGKVTFYEYDNIIPSSATLKSKDAMDKINMYASMPSNARFED
jgi:sterol 24-C-methyltransferase